MKNTTMKKTISLALPLVVRMAIGISSLAYTNAQEGGGSEDHKVKMEAHLLEQ